MFPSITDDDKSNMLYWYGNEFVETTGGFHCTGKDNYQSSFSFGANKITETTYRWGVYIISTKQIDVSNYTKLSANFSFSSVGENYTCVSLQTNGNVTSFEDSFGRLVSLQKNTSHSGYASANVNVSQSLYLMMWNYAQEDNTNFSTNFYAAWLE